MLEIKVVTRRQKGIVKCFLIIRKEGFLLSNMEITKDQSRLLVKQLEHTDIDYRLTLKIGVTEE